MSARDDIMKNAGFRPTPRDVWTLLSQGAEARVWKLSASGADVDSTGNIRTVICKERFSKTYRHPDLDERLTKSRCRSEARVLEKCAKKTDIRVPGVVRVEPPLLYMEHVEGPSLKSYLLDKLNKSKIDFPRLAQLMGEVIGQVHNLGIIHGDLTTSNMLILEDPSSSTEGSSFHLVMIDFGLAKTTSSVEEQAVDLYVLERALESTHPDLPDNFLGMVLQAYSTIRTSNISKPLKPHQQSTLQRLEQVRQRGRKRECFG